LAFTARLICEPAPFGVTLKLDSTAMPSSLKRLEAELGGS
jgi:hypothetical protein